MRGDPQVLVAQRLTTIFKKVKIMLAIPSKLAYFVYMTHSIELTPLLNFQVVAIHSVTGQPQFATISAPSQRDADDFVADMQPDWIVIRSLPTKEILDI